MFRDEGGIAFYVHHKHKRNSYPDVTLAINHLESLFVEIPTPERNIVICVIYRPRNSSLKSFLNLLQDLDEIPTKPRCYIASDINLYLFQKESFKSASNLLSLFLLFFLLFNYWTRQLLKARRSIVSKDV